MKLKLIFVFLSFALCNVIGFAKEGKMKIEKQLVYTGALEKKTPNGMGTITATNSKDKGIFCTITGEFDGLNQVKDPTVYVQGMGKFSVNGVVKLVFDKDKAHSIAIDMTGTTFFFEGQSYKIDALKINIIQEKNNWKAEWSIEIPTWMNEELLSNIKVNFFNRKDISGMLVFSAEPQFSAPDVIKKLGYEANKAIRFFSPGGPIPLKSLTKDIWFLNYPYGEQPQYIYSDYKLVNAKYMYRNEKMELPVSATIMSDGSWVGYVLLECENDLVFFTRADSNKPEVKIEWTESKDTYIGTIKNVNSVITSDFNACNIEFDNGTFTKNYKTQQWINGKSESEIREQLSQKNVDSDLIDSVVSGEMTIDIAISEQGLRDEQERQRVEGIKQEFAKHWKGSEVLFEGTLTGTSEGNQIFGMLFGINNTYFEGNAMLYLNNSGEARFVIGVEPSQKAYSEGRGRAMQVLDACRKIYKDVSGSWTIEGNKLLIDGEDRSITISPDFKTFTYTGMLGSKMTLSKQQ